VDDLKVHKPFSPKKILVPVDFSRCSGSAFQHALALAGSFQARLTLLHVVEPAAHVDNYVTVEGGGESLNQNLVEMARERLEQFVRGIAGEEDGIDSLVRIGRAHSEISDTAQALGSELIVVGTCGRNGGKPTSLGSTVEWVVCHASCPVLTVRCPVACPPEH